MAIFFVESVAAENMDRDRCMARILGNEDMYICRAIRRRGASLTSGSGTSGGGFSGSSLNDFLIFAISDFNCCLISSVLALERS